MRVLAFTIALLVARTALAGWIESPPLASVVTQAKRQLVLVRIGTKW